MSRCTAVICKDNYTVTCSERGLIHNQNESCTPIVCSQYADDPNMDSVEAATVDFGSSATVKCKAGFLAASSTAQCGPLQPASAQDLWRGDAGGHFSLTHSNVTYTYISSSVYYLHKLASHPLFLHCLKYGVSRRPGSSRVRICREEGGCRSG